MRGRVIRWSLPFALVGVVCAGAAMAATTASKRSGAGTVAAVMSAKYGTVLVGPNGRTLYRFTPDKKGTSVCSGTCAKFWPPLVVKGAAEPTAGAGVRAGLLGTVMRSDGSAQVSYAGFPLYYYAGDHRRGDVKGEGVEGKWYAVDAKGALVKHAAVAAKPKPAPKPAPAAGGGAAWG